MAGDDWIILRDPIDSVRFFLDLRQFEWRAHKIAQPRSNSSILR